MGTNKFMILVPLFDLKSLGSFRRLRCRDFKSAALALERRAFDTPALDDEAYIYLGLRAPWLARDDPMSDLAPK
jgi:hypothetical protein